QLLLGERGQLVLQHLRRLGQIDPARRLGHGQGQVLPQAALAVVLRRLAQVAVDHFAAGVRAGPVAELDHPLAGQRVQPAPRPPRPRRTTSARNGPTCPLSTEWLAAFDRNSDSRCADASFSTSLPTVRSRSRSFGLRLLTTERKPSPTKSKPITFAVSISLGS